MRPLASRSPDTYALLISVVVLGALAWPILGWWLWEWRRPEVLQFTITGSGFLKQMVRNIVGTSLMLERKSENPSKMKEIIDSLERRQAGPPAPAQGLYLMRVYYPENLDNGCIEL